MIARIIEHFQDDLFGDLKEFRVTVYEPLRDKRSVKTGPGAAMVGDRQRARLERPARSRRQLPSQAESLVWNYFHGNTRLGLPDLWTGGGHQRKVGEIAPPGPIVRPQSSKWAHGALVY